MSRSNIEDERVPNGRPKSILAMSFSAALDDAFKLDALEDLSQSVEQKKRNVSSRQSELEELEAKIRETEERLKKSTSRSSSPTTKVIMSNHPKSRVSDESSPSRPSSLPKGLSSEERGNKIQANITRPVTRKPEESKERKKVTNGTFLEEDDEEDSAEDEDTEEDEEEQKGTR